MAIDTTKEHRCDHHNDPDCPLEFCRHRKPHAPDGECEQGNCTVKGKGLETMRTGCVPVEDKI